MPNLNLNKYNDTVDYLYGLQKHGIKLGLENTKRLMELLGEPQKSFRPVHIAGTNGKGSTSAIIASILKESGLKTGLYTSPHLVSFTERIRINNKEITEHEVVELTNEIRNKIQNSEMNPTFFEFITAMAFYYFALNNVDWCVVETGMGGRLDATNILLPEVCVITNIGLDHTEFLGENISDIATEKAGIIKQGVPLVTAADNPEALKILGEAAKNRGSQMHAYGRDFKSTLKSIDDKHIVFDYSGLPAPARAGQAGSSFSGDNICRQYNNLELPLSGKYQLYNASLAIRACEILMSENMCISDETVRSGLSNLIFEGRLERISQNPLIIIDSAHNPEAARALSDTVREIFPEPWSPSAPPEAGKPKKIILIAGIMKDKDIKGILKPLIRISDVVILTKPKGERAAQPDTLEEAIKNMGMTDNADYTALSILKTNTVSEAIELAKKIRHKDNIILITGSFYTTGEAKEILGKIGVFSNLRE
jgi:dihydrofolate synthase/folylpolyglutamate synthase